MTEIRKNELLAELDRLLVEVCSDSPDWIAAFNRVVEEFEADGIYFVMPRELWCLVIGDRMLKLVKEIAGYRLYAPVPRVSSSDWDAAIVSCVEETEKIRKEKIK